jgi:hypothetical protein
MSTAEEEQLAGMSRPVWLIPALVPSAALSLPGPASPRAARQESLALDG